MHHGERHLLVEFDSAQRVLSWALHHGGPRLASRVVWLEVCNAELGPDVDPVALTHQRLTTLGAIDAVGMLTSRDLKHYVVNEVAQDGEQARCVATVGLSNALRVGDPPGRPARTGTINLLCWTSVALSSEAIVEGLSVAAEARTLAILEAGISSTVSGLAASGTGTDCIVVACPSERTPVPYAGKHTLVGHLIGAAVHGAVLRGATAWRAAREELEQRPYA